MENTLWKVHFVLKESRERERDVRMIVAIRSLQGHSPSGEELISQISSRLKKNLVITVGFGKEKKNFNN